MRELSSMAVEQVDGGIIPAVAAGFIAYNYIVAAYTATQIATGVGVAAGAAATIYVYNK